MPPLFWATSVFEPLWFAMGACDYMTISLKVVFYIELMAPEQHQWMDHAPDVFLHGSAAERMAVAAESFVAAFVQALSVCFGGLTSWLWGCCALELSVPLGKSSTYAVMDDSHI